MVPSAALEPVRDYQWILSPTQLFLKDTTKNKSSFRTFPLSEATPGEDETSLRKPIQPRIR